MAGPERVLVYLFDNLMRGLSRVYTELLRWA